MIATFSIKSTGEKVALYTTVISRGEALAKFREDYPDLIHRIGMERINVWIEVSLCEAYDQGAFAREFGECSNPYGQRDGDVWQYINQDRLYAYWSDGFDGATFSGGTK